MGYGYPTHDYDIGLHARTTPKKKQKKKKTHKTFIGTWLFALSHKQCKWSTQRVPAPTRLHLHWGLRHKDPIWPSHVLEARANSHGSQVPSPKSLEIDLCNLSRWEHGKLKLTTSHGSRVLSPKYDVDDYVATFTEAKTWDLCWELGWAKN